jgi:3-deoxy-D-manno-octulosonic-acid transferase
MGLALYRGATAMAAPALRLWLGHRRRHGKEDAARLGERYGIANMARPAGPLLWFHAASNGESRSALGLVKALLAARPDLHILFTTFTLTAGRMLQEALPPRALHQFVPLDVPAWVDRFLDHWRPDGAIWIEGDIWPNLAVRAAARGVPLAFVNARLSQRSFARWQKFESVMRPPLDRFGICLAQSPGDAERLTALGARNVKFVGHLKFDGAQLPVDPAALTSLATAMEGRAVWLAASTRPGEEEAVIDAHKVLAKRHAGLLTILVPRHARRGDEVEAILRARGLSVARRSRGDRPGKETEVYLADTMGEMGLFYRLAGIAFIGASLIDKGGQNPLEAAQLGCAMAFGPDMSNCRDIADAMLRAGAAVEIRDGASMADAISAYLSDPALRQRAMQAGVNVAAQGRGATERVLAALAPLLATLPAPDDHSHARA